MLLFFVCFVKDLKRGLLSEKMWVFLRNLKKHLHLPRHNMHVTAEVFPNSFKIWPSRGGSDGLPTDITKVQQEGEKAAVKSNNEMIFLWCETNRVPTVNADTPEIPIPLVKNSL